MDQYEYSDEKMVKTYSKSDKIQLHYAGYLEDGRPFDNSFVKNTPIQEELRVFIEGFALGAINVIPNTVRTLKIAPERAYGTKGGGNIPPMQPCIM